MILLQFFLAKVHENLLKIDWKINENHVILVEHFNVSLGIDKRQNMVT